MENMQIWNKLKRPPATALKTIQAGRLKGKSDINPQWRLEAMTEQFGPIGIGWKYEVVKMWNEPLGSEVACFVLVNVFIKNGENWSDAIPGVGGSMLLQQEKNGLHVSDEGYKMALTDALSVALKQIGVAADIYAGLWDGSKYKPDPKTNPKTNPTSPASYPASKHEYPAPTPEEEIAINSLLFTIETCFGSGFDGEKVAQWYYTLKKSYPSDGENFDKVIDYLEKNQGILQKLRGQAA